jgi:hypothetical protein
MCKYFKKKKKKKKKKATSQRYILWQPNKTLEHAQYTIQFLITILDNECFQFPTPSERITQFLNKGKFT